MNKLIAVAVAAALVPLAAFAFAPKAPPGPGAIEDMLRGMCKALDAGDIEAVKACCVAKDTDAAGNPVLVWDNDLEGKPVEVKGAANLAKYLDGLMGAIKQSKATMTTKLDHMHAACESPALGYATFELVQTATMDGKSESQSFWVTALVTADKENHWHLFHWHSSNAAEAKASGASPK